MASYEVGSGDQEIQLEVKVGTPALANTVVVLRRTSGPVGIILESDEDSGNLPLSYVGEADELKGGRITITANVSLANISPEERAETLESITTEFILSGGTEGVMTFTHEADDVTAPSGNMLAVITKAIKFS